MSDHNHPPVCTCPGVGVGSGGTPPRREDMPTNPECRMHGTDANRHPHYREIQTPRLGGVEGIRAFTGPSDRVGTPLTHDPVTGYAVSPPIPRAVTVQIGPGLDEISPALLDSLRQLGDHYGPTGVARAARALVRPPVTDSIATAEDLAEHPLETLLTAIEEHVPTAPRARKLLERVADLVNGPRNVDYGDARDNFAETGRLWAPILKMDEVTAEQVALCMGQVKVARLINNPTHADSWDDGVGYMALGGGIAEQTREESEQ